MSVVIYTNNRIEIDGVSTGLYCRQDKEGTTVYTGEYEPAGRSYQRHTMPSKRYVLSHDAPLDGRPGRAAFEADVRVLWSQLQAAKN